MDIKIINSKYFIFSILLLPMMIFTQTSDNYTIQQSAITNCGCQSSSEDYSIQDATGQPIPVGQFNSEDFVLYSGLFNNGQTSTSIDEPPKAIIPEKYRLKQNYPNPFNPTTTIEYSLPKDSEVSILIYNLNGKLIERIVNEIKNAGNHKAIWQADNIPTGVYFYTIEAGNFKDVKKCILIK
jgi:hypothetical protein